MIGYLKALGVPGYQAMPMHRSWYRRHDADVVCSAPELRGLLMLMEENRRESVRCHAFMNVAQCQGPKPGAGVSVRCCRIIYHVDRADAICVKQL